MMKLVFQNVTIWDSQLCIKIFNLNGRKALDIAMYVLSRIGDGYAYGLIGIALLIFDFNVALQVIPAGLIAFALEIIAYKTLKLTTRRKRPFEIAPGVKYLMPPPDKFSFPSGHTSAAFVMATLLGTVFPTLFIPFTIFATMVGFSRIYNGLHFPSDVLAGIILGITCAKIGLSLAG